MSEDSLIMANAKNANLYEIIAAEVVTGDLTEIFLVAGEKFTVSLESPAIMAAISAAHAAAPKATADKILVIHYHMSDLFGKHPMFDDGVREVLLHNNVAVQMEIKMIGKAPNTYRVLFQRVDARKLLTETHEKLNDLNSRVRALEFKGTWN
jgi:hypothetical protein